MFVFFLVSFLLLHAVNGFLLESPNCQPVKHFVLIHGSGHGAWSWYKLIALLKSSGHHVTAIDLAASGIDTRPAKTLRSISDYHRPLMDLMAALSPHEKVILVGHSLGGFAISQSMESFPDKISVAVFVTALMPGPSLNISFLNNESMSRTGSLLDSHYEYDDGPNNPPTSLVFGPLFLSSIMYKLSPIEVRKWKSIALLNFIKTYNLNVKQHGCYSPLPQDSELAATLVRPLRLFRNEDLAKKIVLTEENYGSVDRVFIISEKDELSKKDFQEWMIERNPPSEVIEILGCDHMVMMSKPSELWSHLLNVARKYGDKSITSY